MSFHATPAEPVPALPPPVPGSRAQPIAHWTHTLALFIVLAITAAFGQVRARAVANDAGHVTRYLSGILLEWMLLGSVIAGIYWRRAFLLKSFASRSYSNAMTLGVGLAVYLTGMVTLALVGGALYFTPLFHKRNEAVVLAMLPHRPLEYVAWFFVSLTAGLCEELIFRGYLIEQLTAWTQSPIAAILLGGIIFGSVHLYEGAAALLPLAALGVVYGFVARYCKGDLRAVIVAHTLQDFLVPFLAVGAEHLRRLQPH